VLPEDLDCAWSSKDRENEDNGKYKDHVVGQEVVQGREQALPSERSHRFLTLPKNLQVPLRYNPEDLTDAPGNEDYERQHH